MSKVTREIRVENLPNGVWYSLSFQLHEITNHKKLRSKEIIFFIFRKSTHKQNDLRNHLSKTLNANKPLQDLNLKEKQQCGAL